MIRATYLAARSSSLRCACAKRRFHLAHVSLRIGLGEEKTSTDHVDGCWSPSFSMLIELQAYCLPSGSTSIGEIVSDSPQAARDAEVRFWDHLEEGQVMGV